MWRDIKLFFSFLSIAFLNKRTDLVMKSIVSLLEWAKFKLREATQNKCLFNEPLDY